MLRALVKRNEIAEAQTVLKDRLTRELPQKRRLKIGFRGDEFRMLTHFNSSLWFSTETLTRKDYPNIKVPRYWNAFGLGIRSSGNQYIVVEVNSPLSGYTKQVSGLFAEGSQGLYLLHTGRIGGGRKGVGKNAFKKSFEGDWVKVLDDQGRKQDAILIGRIKDRKFLQHVLRFVLEVNRFKEHIARNNRPDEDVIQREEEAAQKSIEINKRLGRVQKKQLTMSRIGQGVFRRNVERLERRCRITGVASKTHLRASHIKPWRRSTNEEKLDGNNGLLLAPHIDHLFDRGYISFADNGQLRLSKNLDKATLNKWHIPSRTNVGSFNKDQRRYLNYHRRYVFRDQ